MIIHKNICRIYWPTNMEQHISYIPDDIGLSSTISLCEDDHIYSFLIGKNMLSKFYCRRPRKVMVPTLNDMSYFLSYLSS